MVEEASRDSAVRFSGRGSGLAVRASMRITWCLEGEAVEEAGEEEIFKFLVIFGEDWQGAFIEKGRLLMEYLIRKNN